MTLLDLQKPSVLMYRDSLIFVGQGVAFHAHGFSKTGYSNQLEEYAERFIAQIAPNPLKPSLSDAFASYNDVISDEVCAATVQSFLMFQVSRGFDSLLMDVKDGGDVIDNANEISEAVVSSSIQAGLPQEELQEIIALFPIKFEADEQEYSVGETLSVFERDFDTARAFMRSLVDVLTRDIPDMAKDVYADPDLIIDQAKMKKAQDDLRAQLFDKIDNMTINNTAENLAPYIAEAYGIPLEEAAPT